MTDGVARLGREPGHDARQVLETILSADERVEPRLGEEPQREVEAPLARPARALRRGHGAYLRRLEREPLRVEALAERQRHRAGPEPAHLEHGGLEGGELERQVRPIGRSTRVDDEIRAAARALRRRKAGPERSGDAGAARIEVHQFDLAPWNACG